jgi:hypothetical protein
MMSPVVLGSELDEDALAAHGLGDADLQGMKIRHEPDPYGGVGRYLLYDVDDEDGPRLVYEFSDGAPTDTDLESVIGRYSETGVGAVPSDALTAGGTHVAGTLGPDPTGDPEDPTQVDENVASNRQVADARARREADTLQSTQAFAGTTGAIGGDVNTEGIAAGEGTAAPESDAPGGIGAVGAYGGGPGELQDKSAASEAGTIEGETHETGNPDDAELTSSEVTTPAGDADEADADGNVTTNEVGADRPVPEDLVTENKPEVVSAVDAAADAKDWDYVRKVREAEEAARSRSTVIDHIDGRLADAPKEN